MPAGTAPPTQCNLIGDPIDCEDVGCSGVVQVRPIVTAQGVCSCDEEVTQCYWASEPTTVTEGLATPYYNALSEAVFLFPDRYDPPPAGWLACEDLPTAAPGCECAATRPCAT